MDFLTHLFDTSGFVPRWTCGDWTVGHGWLHILSDLGIWSAYFTIPVLLAYFAKQKKDLPFRSIFLLFAAFILLCGMTHLIDAIIFWWPAYRLSGLLKFLTAIVSWMTVISLIPIIPTVLKMRSPEVLEQEISRRTFAEEQLQKGNAELELRVAERTKELTQAVADLSIERELLATTLDAVPAAIWIARDPECKDVTGNRTAFEIMRTLRGEKFSATSTALPRRFAEHPLSRPVLPNDLPLQVAAREGVEVHKTEVKIVFDDGEIKYIYGNAVPTLDANGKVTGAVAAFIDITERVRLTALRADVSKALNSNLSIPQTLQQTCEAFVHNLDMSFARIWTVDEQTSTVLELQASAGKYTHLNGPHARVPIGQFKIGRIASTRKAHLSNSVQTDPNVSDQEWAKREGMIAFAGYPLIVEDRISGVVAMFATHAVSDSMLSDIAPLAEGIAQYIDRKRTEQRALEQAELHSVTLASIGEAVLTTNSKAEVTFLNDVACSLTGWTHEDAWNKPIGAVFKIEHMNTGEKILNPVDRVLQNGGEEVVENQAVLIAKDGARHPIEESGAPIRGSNGEVLGVVLVFRDVTEQRSQEMNLRKLAADLSEASRRKDEFLATLSHELRNPLAPIRNGLEIMRIAAEDGKAVANVRSMMERQLTQLVRLVDDLLDVSRISRGKMELRKDDVELSVVLNNAVESSLPLMESSGHFLKVTMPPVPVLMHADAARLAQVFGNLLNNAAKYTEKGGKIRLTAEVQDDQVVVSIKDTGTGIPAEMLPRIFDMFVQGDRTLERAQGGLGLGLTIVQRLVEMHGGTVEARSEGRGHGSEFIVRLPILTAPRITDVTNDQDTTKATSSRRILVVDDNVDSAESLTILLEILGHVVRTVHDGQAAVTAAADFKPEIILLDIGLPVLNGYEACRAIRKLPDGEKPLIVACTGWGQKEDRERTKEAGFNFHMVKPVDPDELLKLINNAKKA